MKNVSVKLFFAVLWKGVCQAVGWFFGLFGYKKVFSNLIWWLFATSVTVILALFAVVFACKMVDIVYEKYYEEKYCYDPGCYNSLYLGKNIYYHDSGDGRSYVFNSLTEEKAIKNILWIARPEGEDSLICFCDGKKRGYFNMHTGQVVIPAKYSHAWVFSEGLASVEEDGSIKFIDGTGEIAIDNVTSYRPRMDGLFFHGGYCVVDNNSAEICCLIDKSGRTVLPQDYNQITPSDNYQLWKVAQGERQGVYDSKLNPIIPLTECKLYLFEKEICMTMPDHTMRKYDTKGHLIHDFYISTVRSLEYETDEIMNRPPTLNVIEEDYAEVLDQNSRVKAVARLRAYVAGDNYQGLMTPAGHPVTMPIYENIEAIGPDLYLCQVSNGDNIVVNGKGEMVK